MLYIKHLQKKKQLASDVNISATYFKYFEVDYWASNSNKVKK